MLTTTLTRKQEQALLNRDLLPDERIWLHSDRLGLTSLRPTHHPTKKMAVKALCPILTPHYAHDCERCIFVGQTWNEEIVDSWMHDPENPANIIDAELNRPDYSLHKNIRDLYFCPLPSVTTNYGSFISRYGHAVGKQISPCMRTLAEGFLETNPDLQDAVKAAAQHFSILAKCIDSL